MRPRTETQRPSLNHIAAQTNLPGLLRISNGQPLSTPVFGVMGEQDTKSLQERQELIARHNSVVAAIKDPSLPLPTIPVFGVRGETTPEQVQEFHNARNQALEERKAILEGRAKQNGGVVFGK